MTVRWPDGRSVSMPTPHGLRRQEIGAAYGMGESAVTQASRQVAEEMEQSESVRISVGMLEEKLGV